MKKELIKKWVAGSLFLVMLIPSVAFAQADDFFDYFFDEARTALDYVSAVNTFDYSGEAASVFVEVRGNFGDAANYVQEGLWTDAGEFFGDIYEELERGWGCFWNTNISSLPNLDPEQNRLRDRMIVQQMGVAEAFKTVSRREKQINSSDPRKDRVEAAVDDAADAVEDFMCLNVHNEIDETPSGGFDESNTFIANKQAAEKAVNLANISFVAPGRPGEVPKGDLLEDFIPQLIRLLFRFASLAVFVSFVVSGLMFVAAFGNEERVTKAKQMLYWTLVGFAFVTLAFAMVKAITDIDFFGFI